MKHFIDHINMVSKQTFSCALIFDAKGKQCGKIIVRFTDSQIGYNHQLGMVFGDLDFGTTFKGDCYSNPDTLIKALQSIDCKALNFRKEIVGIGSGSSQFNDIKYIRQGRKTFRIEWCM